MERITIHVTYDGTTRRLTIDKRCITTMQLFLHMFMQQLGKEWKHEQVFSSDRETKIINVSELNDGDAVHIKDGYEGDKKELEKSIRDCIIVSNLVLLQPQNMLCRKALEQCQTFVEKYQLSECWISLASVPEALLLSPRTSE